MLNKQKGNMYGFVTHTWNPIKGECSHGCEYCYMRVWKQKPIRLIEKELNYNLGKDNYIFIGSSTDMFAEDVPTEWITNVLDHCKKFNNKYLFQSKNPQRFLEFQRIFPKHTILCTTIESFEDYPKISGGQSVYMRARYLSVLSDIYKTMITIEPILDFDDAKDFACLIKTARPNIVNIGADSKGHKLPEPSSKKISELIIELKKFTEVNLKPNLKRLMK